MGCGLWQNSTPTDSQIHPLTEHQKFVTGDYVGNLCTCAKFGANPSWGFWANSEI